MKYPLEPFSKLGPMSKSNQWNVAIHQTHEGDRPVRLSLRGVFIHDAEGRHVRTRSSIPPFAALRAFEAYGRLGGFRKAAQSLGVDHAAVSRHLRSLEAWLGTTLIERERQADHWLTADGKTYHMEISRSLFAIAAASEDLRAHYHGRFLIWCSPGLANHWLVPRLPDFNARYPRIDLALRPSDEIARFAANEADGDMRYLRDGKDSQLPPGVRWLELARPAIFPVASPDYVRSIGGAPRCMADFLSVRLLHEDDDREWATWLAAHDVITKEPLPGPRLWHANVTLDAARTGQGVALANELLVSESLAEGRLMVLSPTDQAIRHVELGGYNFIAREDRWNSLPLTGFRRWLQEQIAGMAQVHGATEQPHLAVGSPSR